MIKVSVIIPAYNPGSDELGATLAALRAQSLAIDEWELVIIDNRSSIPVPVSAVSWHPNGTVFREETPGLVAARLAGFARTTGPIVVVVDQDNILAPDFLTEAMRIGRDFPWLGTWGAGTIVPRFERPDLAPPSSLHSLLTLRSAAADLWSNDIDHHESTPWGAGLCVRRSVIERYAESVARNPAKRSLDLKGDQRLSGGDTDIAYTACHMGLGKGVFRSLRLEHMIPAERCSAKFLCKTGEGRGYSGVLHHFVLHGTLPPDDRGLFATLRRVWRLRNLSSLERQVVQATEAGRRRAHRELAPRSNLARK